MTKNKKPIFQKHHIIYKDGKNKKEITRNIRKGVHRIVTLIRFFNFLTNEEVETIKLEAELKKKFVDGKSLSNKDLQ